MSTHHITGKSSKSCQNDTTKDRRGGNDGDVRIRKQIRGMSGVLNIQQNKTNSIEDKK